MFSLQALAQPCLQAFPLSVSPYDESIRSRCWSRTLFLSDPLKEAIGGGSHIIRYVYPLFGFSELLAQYLNWRLNRKCLCPNQFDNLDAAIAIAVLRNEKLVFHVAFHLALCCGSRKTHRRGSWLCAAKFTDIHTSDTVRCQKCINNRTVTTTTATSRATTTNLR